MIRKVMSFATLAVLVCAFTFACAQRDEDVKLREKIHEYMERMTARGFSGALLVAKEHKIIVSEGYGLADREQNIPVTDQTVFPIGSITKQFTAAAILKLQMDGKLSVNDPITKFFVNVPDDKRGITLHHLLTHTAGFPGAIGDDFEPIDREEFIELAMKTELRHKPGEVYEYSNVGYSLLGAIIEKVSGKSYEVFLRENLSKPAGMIKTGYVLPDWNPDDLAHGYRGDYDWGTLRDHPWADDGPYWNLRANGGILSTVGDMYKWHVALEGEEVLSEEAKRAYYTPHVQEGEGADSFYGYGWAIFETPRGTRLIAHNGGNTIFAADFLRYVDEDVVIIALSNTAGKPAWEVSRTVARIVFGYEYDLLPEKVESLSEADLQESATGRRALALLSLWAEGDTNVVRDFIEEHCSPQFVERASTNKLVRFLKKDQQGLGEVHLDRVEKTGGQTFELTVQSKRTGEWWLVSLKFEEEPPHQIAGIGVVDTPPPVAMDDPETSK